MHFKSILTIGLILYCQSLAAQEALGLNFDNYTPVNKAQLNPVEIVDQKPWIDIQLAGVGTYLRSSFLYSPTNKIYGLASKDLVLREGVKNNRISYNAQIIGPSASIALGRQSFALTTAIRSYGFSSKIPEVIPRIILNNDENLEDGTYKANNTRVKTMSWFEIGGTYGRILKSKNKDVYSGAITLKSLHGIHESSIYVKDANIDVDNGEFTLNNLDSKYSFTAPSAFSGRGFGMNIGFSYQKKLKNVDQYVPHTSVSDCQSTDYKYKVSASLIDLGYINFKNNSNSGNLTENSDLEDIDATFNPSLNTENTRQTNRYIGTLPTAFSGQFDYNFQNGLYAGGAFVQKIHKASFKGTERTNLIWAHIRYETKLVTAGIPISFQNYKNPQLGLYLRLAWISIGTENIHQFLFNSDMKSASAYASLRIPIHQNPSCGSKKNGKMKGISSCPAW
jgi:hypothetical protein